MKNWNLQSWLLKFSTLLYLLNSAPTVAQIKPDATLLNNSLVTNQGQLIQIDGGTRAGGNLFHSFDQFSVPTGGTAFFNNANDVTNIFSRITGGSISNIDGILKANGTANLFLLNPNGIVFGKNAQLNIGGSFLASTASSIKFADGSFFSATNPQAAPLLTINVPIGLQFGHNPGAIRVEGEGNSFTLLDPIFSPIIRGSPTGLEVQPGKTLALVGGDVTLEGGNLIAEQGRIEVGSVGDGQVRLNTTTSGWTLGYEGVSKNQDILLSQRASLDASGLVGGSIQLQGDRVTFSGGSTALIQNQGSQTAGNLTVNASDSLELSGTTPDGRPSSLINETLAGNGGDIGVSTQRLLLQDGGGIVTRTFSVGKGGNLTVRAADSVQLIAFSPINYNFFSNISALSYSSGHGGNITISTKRLTALDGGTVTSAIFGTGLGGDVTVNATNSVELIGLEPIIFQPTILSASTLNAGKAGSLKINTTRLLLQDGGRIDASTFASGDAGSITVNASQSVEISGTASDAHIPSLVSSEAQKLTGASQKFFRLSGNPSGSSGDVTINTRQLRIADGALVNVRNEGLGNAGSLQINAGSIILDNSGAIAAATKSGSGGSIFLQTHLLQLRHNSTITATAGGFGNGGNIILNPDILVILDSSNINANAINGRGGNIQINTQGFFASPDSDISASSQLGINGQVKIGTPAIEPSKGLVVLLSQVVSLAGTIAEGCSAAGRHSSSKFTITGRGGLPPNPSDTLSSETILKDWGTYAQPQERFAKSPITDRQIISSTPTSMIPAQLVEAQGWIVTDNGEVFLTAEPTTGKPHSPWLTLPACNQTGFTQNGHM